MGKLVDQVLEQAQRRTLEFREQMAALPAGQSAPMDLYQLTELIFAAINDHTRAIQMVAMRVEDLEAGREPRTFDDLGDDPAG